MNDLGFIQIHRRLLNWEWYSDIPVRITFIHLLIIANWEEKNWKGIKIKRGQVVIVRRKLSKDIGISEQQLRTSLTKLKSTHEITSKATNKFSVVTLVNYNNYQDEKNLPTSKKTNNQPATNQQLKEGEKKKTKKDIPQRKQEFQKLIEPYLKKYSKELCNTFYFYWTEHGENDSKMRFEKQTSFGIGQRLATFKKNQKKFDKSGDNQQTSKIPTV